MRAVDHDESATALLSETGVARAPMAWLRFGRVDLRGGIGRVTAMASGPAGATLTLRTDDPVFGPVLATIPLADDVGVQNSLAAATAPVSGTGGIGDLYVVFSEAGVTIGDLVFDGVAAPFAGSTAGNGKRMADRKCRSAGRRSSPAGAAGTFTP